MIIKGIVGSKGNQIILENGARLTFGESDCATPLSPGDAVVLDTEQSPSIRRAKSFGIFTPVRETKVSGVEEAKALIQALADEL